MTKPRSAGELHHSVAFDARVEENPDSPIDYGNVVSEWRQQFVTRAGYVHLRGGESVMAGRLQGRHPLVMFVRAASSTLSVTTDWRARDTRTGTVYNIRDITPSEDGRWVEYLCESGVASG